jgi:hypothetical protein
MAFHTGRTHVGRGLGHYSCQMTGRSLKKIGKISNEWISKQTLRFPLETVQCYSVMQIFTCQIIHIKHVDLKCDLRFSWQWKCLDCGLWSAQVWHCMLLSVFLEPAPFAVRSVLKIEVAVSFKTVVLSSDLIFHIWKKLYSAWFTCAFNCFFCQETRLHTIWHHKQRAGNLLFGGNMCIRCKNALFSTFDDTDYVSGIWVSTLWMINAL